MFLARKNHQRIFAVNEVNILLKFFNQKPLVFGMPKQSFVIANLFAKG